MMEMTTLRSGGGAPRGGARIRLAVRPLFALIGTIGLAGCEDGPTEVVFEVIEETQFAASLGIGFWLIPAAGIDATLYLLILLEAGVATFILLRFQTSRGPTRCLRLWHRD